MAEPDCKFVPGRCTIGWIGAGAMGLPICENLLKAGCSVVAYDRDNTRAKLATLAGASRAGSAQEVAERSELIFSMVYDDLAFEEVVTGAQGVLAGIRPGALYVDMSTVSPRSSKEMGELLERHCVRYLRAPVSGSVGLAKSGDITVMVSGDPADLATCRPILETFSRGQFYQGPGEAARAVKLIVNALVVGSTALIGEALDLGAAAGLSRDKLVDAINESIVGSRHYASRAEALKHRRYGDAGPVRMAAKDLDLALNLGGDSDLDLPLLRHARARVGSALARGLGNVEVTVLAEPSKEWIER